MENVKGFKVFNPDWTCRGFQYEVGKTYEEDVTPSVCDRGFHFCKQAKDCFNYYGFDTNNSAVSIAGSGSENRGCWEFTKSIKQIMRVGVRRLLWRTRIMRHWGRH